MNNSLTYDTSECTAILSRKGGGQADLAILHLRTAPGRPRRKEIPNAVRAATHLPRRPHQEDGQIRRAHRHCPMCELEKERRLRAHMDSGQPALPLAIRWGLTNMAESQGVTVYEVAEYAGLDPLYTSRRAEAGTIAVNDAMLLARTCGLQPSTHLHHIQSRISAIQDPRQGQQTYRSNNQ